MAMQTNFYGDDGDCDDNIIATFGDAQLVRHTSGQYELRGGAATDHTSAKEWISLFLHEAVVSSPSPQTPVPSSVTRKDYSADQTKDTIMKRNKLVITFLFAAVLALGCTKEQTASEQLEKVKTETKATAEDMKDYTFAQKAEFTEKMQSQLTALNRDLDQLGARIEKSSDTADQVTELNKQLENVRNASESTWDSVKASSQKSFNSLKDGFQKSRQWVSDKIAP